MVSVNHMSRTVLALLALPALLLAGCDSGRSHVLVGSGKPDIHEGSEWLRELERVYGTACTKDWKVKYNQYSQSLVARAAEEGFDSLSLSNVLQTILTEVQRESWACLPFAAYRVEQKNEPVWIVNLVWVHDGDRALWEYGAYTINAQNFRMIDFYKCQ